MYGYLGNAPIAFDSRSLYFAHVLQLWTTVVAAGPPCAARSTASVSSSLVTAGHFFTFAIFLRDQFSNDVQDCMKMQVVISSNFSVSRPVDMENCSPLKLNLTVSGSYAIDVKLSSIDQVSAVIVVVTSKFYPRNSLVNLSSTIVTAGVPISVVLLARDIFGNPMPFDNYNGLPDSIADINSSERLVGSLTYSNSSLKATFTSSGLLRVSFKNKVGAVGPIFSLNVRPGTACASLTSVQGSGLSVATSGLPSHFTVVSRDAYGNLNLASNLAAFETSSQKYQYLASAVMSSGLHFVRKPGSFKPQWSMSVFSYVPGPLTATFYSQANFAEPNSVADAEASPQRLDSLSRQIFQSKSMAISGFVRIDRGFTASFAFSECHNTCTRVLVDGVAIYSCNSLQSLPMSPGTWAFVIIEHACLRISAASPRTARLLITESISSAFFNSASTFKVHHVTGSPFSVTSAPGFPYLRAMVPQGSGISVCTFGSLATFSMLIRDVFAQPTSLSGSLVEFVAVGQNTSTLTCSSASTAAPDVCRFSYVCGSTSVRLAHSKARVPGLVGEYFESVLFTDYLQPGAVQGFSKIDFELNFEDVAFSPLNNFDAAVNGATSAKRFGSQYFSVRWTGLLQAQFSEVYTLQCTSYGAVKIFIDGLMILAKSNTAQRQAVQGTISLVQFAYVDLRIDYAHSIGQFGMKLEWQSKSRPLANVPRNAMWHTQRGVLPDIVVSSVAGPLSLPVAKLSGAGLTIATAGVLAKFRVFTSDAIGMPSFLNSSRVWATARSLGGPTYSAIRQSGVRSDSIGNCDISYVPLILGDYAFDILHMAPGMLMSTVYATSVFLNPVVTPVALNLSLDSSIFAESYQSSSLTSRMSASWKGFFKPASVPVTTFQVQLGSAADKIRLAVDGTVIIDKFSITSASVTSVSATIFLSDANAFYDIAIDFAHATGALACAVTTQDGPIPSSRLFTSGPIGSLAPALLVRAAGACAATSKVMGVGAVKTVSCDLKSNLELHIRDAYNNPTSIGPHQVRALAYPLACAEDSVDCDDAVALDVSQGSPSMWNIAIILTRSGTWSVAVSLSQPGFVSATYYASAGFLPPFSVGPVPLNSELKEYSKSMRMSGFIKPLESVRKFSFKWAGDHVYYPSLFIDSPFFGDRAANYTKSPVVSAGIDDSRPVLRMRALNIDAPLVHPGFQPSLLWSYENVSWTAVPSGRLFTREHVQNVVVRVLAAKTCAATSYVRGGGFTVLTCGVETTFSVVARDEYWNMQGSVQDRWLVRVSRDDLAIASAVSNPSNRNVFSTPGLTNSSLHFLSSKTILCF